MPVLLNKYIFEDIDSKLFFDLDEPKHDQCLLQIFELILENLADFAKSVLVPTDKPVILIKKYSIEEAIWADLPIQVPCSIIITFVIVDLNDLAIGKIQSILQIDNFLWFCKSIYLSEKLLGVDFNQLVVAYG